MIFTTALAHGAAASQLAALHPALDAVMWAFAVLLVIAFFLAITQHIEHLLDKDKERRNDRSGS